MKRKKINSYVPGWPIRAVFLLAGFLVAAVHVFAIRAAGLEEIPLPAVAIIMLADALLLWWMIIFSSQSQITLYDEGIELERGASKVFTPWSNVSHLGIKGFGRNRRRGIFLHRPVTPETKGLAEKLFFGRASDFIPIGRYVNLPASWNPFSREINTDKLLETDFGKQLFELAPHLFGQEEKTKNRLEDEGENEGTTIETIQSKLEATKD